MPTSIFIPRGQMGGSLALTHSFDLNHERRTHSKARFPTEEKNYFSIFASLKPHVKRNNKIIFICKFVQNSDYLAYSHHYIFIHDLFLSFSENLNFSPTVYAMFELCYTHHHMENAGAGSASMYAYGLIRWGGMRRWTSFEQAFISSYVSIYIYSQQKSKAPAFHLTENAFSRLSPGLAADPGSMLTNVITWCLDIW